MTINSIPETLNTKPETRARRGLIVFASKYGSTAEYAFLMAEKLSAGAVRVSEASSTDISKASYVIMGSPIYGYSVLPEMEAFLEKYRESLAEKPLAAFVVCGDTMWNPKAGEGGHKNLEKLTKLLPVKPRAMEIFGGRMLMDDLDDEDGPKIMAFYKRVGREATGFDRMELEKVEPFVEEISKVLRDK